MSVFNENFSALMQNMRETSVRESVPFQRMNILEVEFGLEEMGEVG